MALSRRRSLGRLQETNPWPAWVDALSTIILAVMFALMLFTIAQALLQTTLGSRDQELARLARALTIAGERARAAEESLQALTREQAAELRARLAAEAERQRLQQALAQAEQARSEAEGRAAQAVTLTGELSALRQERDAARADREAAAREVSALSAELGRLQAASAAATASELQAGTAVQAAEARATAAQAAAAAAEAERARLQQRLFAALAEVNRMRLDAGSVGARVVAAETRIDRAEARAEEAESREASLLQERAAMVARTAQAEAEITRLIAAARAAGLEVDRLTGEVTAREEDLRLAREALEARTAEIAALRAQLETVTAELGGAQATAETQSVTIADLNQKLTEALKAQVVDLQNYRSDFFGRMRRALADRPEFRVVGDRFVIQSEVLFPTGSADLSPQGQEELAKAARVLLEVGRSIPPEADWVIRVDGHTDRRPIASAFRSNWELSAARAISVVRYLESQGFPPDRLAAAGFAEFQPLDPDISEEAYARNRRIELKLDAR